MITALTDRCYVTQSQAALVRGQGSRDVWGLGFRVSGLGFRV